MLSLTTRPQKFSEVVGQPLAVKTLQRIASAERLPVHSIVLQGSYGCGKCVHPDTVLKTDSGLIKARILPQNQTFTIANKINGFKVSQTNPDTECLTFTTNRGKVFSVTHNHPVLIYQDGFSFERADQIKVGSTVFEDFSKLNFDFIFNEWVHLVGIFLASGTITSTDYSLEVVIKDKELDHYLTNFLNTSNFKYHRVFTKNTQSKFQFEYDSEVYRILNNLYSVIDRVNNKIVFPKDFYDWDFSSQVSLFQGLMDSKGKVLKEIIALSLLDKELLINLAHVASGLGFPTSIEEIPNKVTSYQLQLFLAVEHSDISKVFTVKSKIEKALNNSQICQKDWLSEAGKYIVSDFIFPDTIVSIESTQAEFTVDLECEGEPFFYTSGIITHNTTLSKIFAKATGCTSFKKTGDVCNECEHCQSVVNDTTHLYREYDASQIGNVESTKALIDNLSFKVLDTETRVITIDEAHVSSAQALSALLKVIEEGIPNTVFLFCTTEPLMKTIMSRSCVIPVYTLSDTEMANQVRYVADLHKIEITDQQINSIVIKSQGHVRDAMQNLDHFSIAGEKAIETPYNLIRQIFLNILKKQPIEEQLKLLSTYQTATIAPTISLFLKNCFAGVGAFETKVRDTGNAKVLFNHFFTPQIRQALNDEYGVQLAFLTLIN